jgi:hypothetical protein
MIEHSRLEQIREVLRLSGQDDSLINESLNLSTPGDFLGLLRKLRDSLDMSIKTIEDNQKKMDL